jgi:hypothetical protein
LRATSWERSFRSQRAAHPQMCELLPFLRSLQQSHGRASYSLSKTQTGHMLVSSFNSDTHEELAFSLWVRFGILGFEEGRIVPGVWFIVNWERGSLEHRAFVKVAGGHSKIVTVEDHKGERLRSDHSKERWEVRRGLWLPQRTSRERSSPTTGAWCRST